MVKESQMGVYHPYSQSFTPTQAHVYRLQLAPLYTLQDGLARDPQKASGLEHGQVPLGSLLQEAVSQLLTAAQVRIR